VTERKQNENELLRLRKAVEDSGDAVLMTDADGTITYVNPEFTRVYGYTAEEVVGKMTPRILKSGSMHPEDYEVFWQTISRKNSIKSELINKTKEGRLVTVKTSVNAILDPDRNIIGYMAIQHDIPDQKQTKENLTKSEERYRNLINTMNEGLGVQDANGMVTFMNKQACEMLGYTSEEVIGKPATFFFDEENQKILREQMVRRRKGEHQRYEIAWSCKDGSKIHTIMAPRPLLDEKGNFEGSVAVFTDITERKRAEILLHESEFFFKESQRAAFIGSYKTDFTKGLWESSEVLDKIFGIDKSYVRSVQGWLDIVHPDDRVMMDQYLKQEVIAKRNRFDKEYRIVRIDDKQERWVHGVGDVEFDEIGNILSMIGTIQDITERKHTEEALRQSEGRYRTLAEAAQDEIFIIGKDDRIHYINNFGAQRFKNEPKDMIGRPRTALFPPHIAEQQKRSLEKVLQTGESVYEETLTPTPSGDVWLGTRLAPIKNEMGEATAVLGISRDISQRVEAAKALTLFRALIDQVNDSIEVVDPETGRFLDVNEKSCIDHGYTRQELLSSTIFDIDSTVDESVFQKTVAGLRKSGSIIWDGHHRRKDGTTFPVEVNIRYVRLDRDYIVTVGRDITERKREEEHRHQLEQQLIQAQKLESLGTLASGIAHDFNNILAIIMGHSSLLERLQPDPAKLSQSIDAIQKTTTRGAALVRQLLTFARKTETAFESVMVNDIIKEIVKLLKETFPKTIDVTMDLKKDLPLVLVDSNQIHQVLINLCVNARDAMPRGGTLSISSSTIENDAMSSKYPKATAREYIMIQVADSGTGMDEATKQRIFEPFFTTKGVGKGTGLGLALVYGIIENHDGYIDVVSEVGKGTTFSIYIPIQERTIVYDETGKKTDQDVTGGTETILLIEDEEMLRELVKVVLVSNGYSVLTAQDGEEGVSVFSRHQKEIAVVVSDMGLPKVGGEAVFKQIKTMNPKAKIILASGFIDQNTKSEVHKAGIRHFIQKPYTPSEVLRAIREVLDVQE
jgi:PAS domain S-box-containing protein